MIFELDGYSITALASNSDGLSAIADRNSVWHRNLNGEWNQVAFYLLLIWKHKLVLGNDSK